MWLDDIQQNGRIVYQIVSAPTPPPHDSPYFKQINVQYLCSWSCPTKYFAVDMYNDTEGILIKFADDIKLGAIANTLSNWILIQKQSWQAGILAKS